MKKILTRSGEAMNNWENSSSFSYFGIDGHFQIPIVLVWKSQRCWFRGYCACSARWNPFQIEELWRNSMIDLEAGRDAREVIGAHLCASIFTAIKQVRNPKSQTSDRPPLQREGK
jgi:hypothetical protein